MSFSQSPLPLLHPPFHPGVNPVPCSSCQIVPTLEERGGMPGKGGIIASVDGQLALSKREVGVQKTTVTFVVASASAAFSSPQVWQNITPRGRRRQQICFSLCWNRQNKDPCVLPNLLVLLHNSFRNLWHLLHICEGMHWSHCQQTGKCAKASTVSWAAAPFQVICSLKSQEASWLCLSP